jgi:GDP-L-fucose synthase
MKVLVLGSAGFIGCAVYDALAKTDAQLVSVPCSSWNLGLDKDTSWLSEALWGSDVVYLCAGRTGGVGRMARDPFSFIYPNVRIHMNVFEACAAAHVRRVVCVQSTTGYPDSDRPMFEDEYLEGELHPAYFVPGNAHRFIYRLAQMHKELEVVFFRPSNVYGPRNSFDPEHSHVIEATVRKVAEHQDPFVIWGNGREIRDAVYIEDLAEAMVHGLDCPPGAYNVASGQEMNVNEIAATLLNAEGYSPTIQYDESKPTAIPARRVSIAKARSVLGWAPKVSMEEGLKRTLDWYNCRPVTA